MFVHRSFALVGFQVVQHGWLVGCCCCCCCRCCCCCCCCWPVLAFNHKIILAGGASHCMYIGMHARTRRSLPRDRTTRDIFWESDPSHLPAWRSVLPQSPSSCNSCPRLRVSVYTYVCMCMCMCVRACVCVCECERPRVRGCVHSLTRSLTHPLNHSLARSFIPPLITHSLTDSPVWPYAKTEQL